MGQQANHTFSLLMDTYALYLDDIRHPPQTEDNWVLCRTVATMRELLQERGIPTLASFDYELGRTDPGNTGYDALNSFLDLLITHAPQDDTEVHVEVNLHTSSAYGAKRMAALLQERYDACNKAGIHLVHRR